MSDAPDLANQIIDEWIAENAMSDELVRRWDEYAERSGVLAQLGMGKIIGQQMRDRIEALTAERDRLREALAFYADEENYKWYSAVDPCGCCSSWYEPKIHINGDDSGQIARAALKGESHE